MNEPLEVGEILSRSDEETIAHAVRMAKVFPHVLVLLRGPLGAGKTTWTRGFARGLGVSDEVSSPTYTILNVYRRGDRSLYHLDLYRLGCLEEVYDVGLFEILDAGFPCVVEWSERVPELAGWPHLDIVLTPTDEEGGRRILWALRKGTQE
ncbi:MAG: tRNA (adenosine(37)-N6)-threonylcarbamoyltransferase complex ATPase subunit type 1 TsaE [Candidatus Ozemobacteraceae bacterium]